MIASLSGCASPDRTALLESQLRERESRIRELETTVAETQELLKDQDQELAAARRGVSAEDGSRSSVIHTVSAPVEVAAAWGSVEDIRIHKLTSGLLVDAETPVVNIVIQPVDADGELVKVAGGLSVSVSVVGQDGTTRLVQEKAFSITESRQLWTQSLIATGFHLQLTDVADIRAEDDLLLSARLDLGSDRKFSTTHLVEGR